MTTRDWTPAFEALVDGLEYPMYVVTAASETERAGCLVGFVTQCSIDPPALLVCISKANRTYDVARSARALVVHFLGEQDQAIARLFGEQTGDDVDKFSRCAWSPGPHGAPVLDGGRGWAAGEVTSRTDVGDHVAHVVRIRAAQDRHASSAQLGFGSAKDMSPGHPA